ncbi:MAG: hypothetical protein ACRDZY_04840, partial [Acidimicrobiales bacterium]
MQGVDEVLRKVITWPTWPVAAPVLVRPALSWAVWHRPPGLPPGDPPAVVEVVAAAVVEVAETVVELDGGAVVVVEVEVEDGEGAVVVVVGAVVLVDRAAVGLA